MQNDQHKHDEHDAPHEEHSHGGTGAMAASATLHCLTGCAIGEIGGLLIGAGLGLGIAWTIPLSVALAFLTGFTLSTLPLVRVGQGFVAALSVVVAADTVSILTMEIVDNTVMALVPGALHAGLGNPTFWFSMILALGAAFVAAYPVNRYLLSRGKGHALTHEFHSAEPVREGFRRFLPNISTVGLALGLLAFMLAGWAIAGLA